MVRRRSGRQARGMRAMVINGDVDVFLELGGADVDERAAADDGVSGLAALGDGGEGLGDFPERVFAKMIVHGEIPF